MNGYIEFCNEFDSFQDDQTSKVFQIFPKVFADSRGSFTEVLNSNRIDGLEWFNDHSWIKQINRSVSAPNVCRGMHAQKGKSCQSKLVECISGLIYDIILDGRPNSKTFGKVKAFKLNSTIANKLFVPCGFLHGFMSMENNIAANNIFQYYVGGHGYDKSSEFSVSISQTLDELKQNENNEWLCNSSNILLSEKDTNCIDLCRWLSDTMHEYQISNKLWYK